MEARGWRWGREEDGEKQKVVVAGEDEDGNLGFNEDSTGNRSGRLDWGWNFSWDECGVSGGKNGDVCEGISWIVPLDEIWSEVISSGEEDTKGKAGDADNIWNFGGPDEEFN